MVSEFREIVTHLLLECEAAKNLSVVTKAALRVEFEALKNPYENAPLDRIVAFFELFDQTATGFSNLFYGAAYAVAQKVRDVFERFPQLDKRPTKIAAVLSKAQPTASEVAGNS